jgi:hypothetical protein
MNKHNTETMRELLEKVERLESENTRLHCLYRELYGKLWNGIDALRAAKESIILHAHDTLYVPYNYSPNCTTVDYIDWSLSEIVPRDDKDEDEL